MPSVHADVRAVGALGELDGALQRFSVNAAEAVAEIRAHYERARTRLDERADDAARTVRRCAAMLDNADADDAEHWQNALEQASEQRDELSRWRRRVEEAYDLFRRDAAHFDGMLHETLRRGRGVLRTKIDLLNDYLAMQLDGSGSTDGPSVDAFGKGWQGRTLVMYPLPPGFRWVPLSQIELRQEPSDVQSATEFRKTDKETMQLGFVHLQSEILPCLSDVNAHTSEYFAHIDSQNDNDYEHGLQRIFDAFFGLDHVHLGHATSPGMFDVINGRHRIRIAHELGWVAIPAKVEMGSESNE